MTRLVLSELCVTNYCLSTNKKQTKHCSLADSFLDPME